MGGLDAGRSPAVPRHRRLTLCRLGADCVGVRSVSLSELGPEGWRGIVLGQFGSCVEEGGEYHYSPPLPQFPGPFYGLGKDLS